MVGFTKFSSHPPSFRFELLLGSGYLLCWLLFLCLLECLGYVRGRVGVGSFSLREGLRVGVFIFLFVVYLLLFCDGRCLHLAGWQFPPVSGWEPVWKVVGTAAFKSVHLCLGRVILRSRWRRTTLVLLSRANKIGVWVLYKSCVVLICTLIYSVQFHL